MRKKLALGLALVTGLALVAVFFGGMMVTPVVPSVRADWPTPPGEAFGGGDFVFVNYMGTTGIATTTKTCGNGQQTAAYVLADVQGTLDMSSGITQFITCTLEFSNDNTNWCTIPMTVMTAITDVTQSIWCEQLWLFGRYSRACCESSATTLYTVTQRAKAYN